jgi:L-lactate dehydrogenase complex protein LldG
MGGVWSSKGDGGDGVHSSNDAAGVRASDARDPAGHAIAAAAARLLDRVPAVRPNRVTGPPADVFLDRVSTPAIGATVDRIATLDDFPAAVRRYLASRHLLPSVALQPHPALRALDWSGIETHATIAVDEPIAAGLALGAIAETGSLVFHSGPDSPTLFAFLPVHHIVAVEASRVWPWLEDYVAAYAGQAQPRNVNLITGASGTTDIEGTLVHGAHGPGFLHVVLISR